MDGLRVKLANLAAHGEGAYQIPPPDCNKTAQFRIGMRLALLREMTMLFLHSMEQSNQMVSLGDRPQVVYVVDDDPILRELAALLVDRVGLASRQFPNAEHA